MRSPNPSRLDKLSLGRKKSSILQGGAHIMNHDSHEISPLSVLDSTFEGSISSPNRRKKVTWRNESDYLIQLTKGNKLEKHAKDLTAQEADQNLNYGERFGKNVIDNEYKRNLHAIKLFK